MFGAINKRIIQTVLVILTVGFYVIILAQKETVTTRHEAPFDQEAALAKLREQIKGRENEPAEKVFKNIQMLKSVSAERLLMIMERGYARWLGVNCTHCHVPDKWEAEDNTKQIAREMSAMVVTINNSLLKNIKNLKSATPNVTCFTCHRGQIKPALNLPMPSPSPTGNLSTPNPSPIVEKSGTIPPPRSGEAHF